MGISLLKLFKGFTFKAKDNGKDKAGSNLDNMKQAMKAMGEAKHPGAQQMSAQFNDFLSQHEGKTWNDLVKMAEDQKECPQVGYLKTELAGRPYVKDLIDCFRQHGGSTMNLSMFCENKQVSIN